MQIREAVENRYGERITKLQNGTYVTVSKWIEGESLDKLELNDAICYRIGDMLARLHQKAKGFSTSPAKSYGMQHCECTKRRIQTLENMGLSTGDSSIMQKCCDRAGALLEKARDEFQMIHKVQSIANNINRSTKFYQSVMLCFSASCSFLACSMAVSSFSRKSFTSL